MTETIDSSFLPYADLVNAGALTWVKEAAVIESIATTIARDGWRPR